MGIRGVVLCVLAVVLQSCTIAEVRADNDEKPILYKDASQPVAVRVSDLYGRMTLDEKIGQMTQIEITVSNESSVSKYYIGQCAWKVANKRKGYIVLDHLDFCRPECVTIQLLQIMCKLWSSIHEHISYVDCCSPAACLKISKI